MSVLTNVRREAATAPTTTGTDVVVIAHGSPDSRHRRSVEHLGGRLSALTGHEVTVAFLEHDIPRATSVLEAPVRPLSRTVVLPLLVTAGVHWRDDIPPVVAHHGSTAVLLPPPEPALFEEAVRELVGGAGHVILASAGSSRPQVVSRFAALAQRLGPGDVDVCLTPDQVAECVRPGSTVVPFLTADGIFADRIRRASGEARVTDVLGDTHGFAATLADIIRSAGADRVTV